MTNNIVRRLKEHKNGRSKYTKRYNGNLNVIYLEEIECRTKKECFNRARKREKEIKKWSRARIEKLVKLKRDKIVALIIKYLDKPVIKKIVKKKNIPYEIIEGYRNYRNK